MLRYVELVCDSILPTHLGFSTPLHVLLSILNCLRSQHISLSFVALVLLSAGHQIRNLSLRTSSPSTHLEMWE